MNYPALLPALVLLPLLLAAVTALVPRGSRRTAGAAAASTTGALGIGVVALIGGGSWELALAGWEAPLGITLRADGTSTAFLALVAVVGTAVTVYAAAEPSLAGGPDFWPLWLVLWAGLNGVVVAGDLFTIYVMLELVTIAAVALVALGGRSAASPALRYLFVGVVGSLLFLLAVALVYAETGTLDLPQATAALEPGPVLTSILALTLLGMGTKMALFPLHAWLPVAHPAAPAAVSAVLSALVIKAGVIVLWRIWFGIADGTAAVQVLGVAAGIAGAVAVFWGGAMALRSSRLKPIVAYSTVAQVGYFAIVLSLADGSAAGWSGGVILVLAHGLAKAAMFLAAGTLAFAYGTDRLSRLHGAISHTPMTVAALAIAGISLAGLPPTFGFVAKWQLLVATIEQGEWWWIGVLLLGGLLTFGYTAAMVRATFNRPGDDEVPAPYPVPAILAVVPFILAIASVAFGVFSAGLVDLLAEDPTARGRP
ncbi:complex I subunit 5 family protein [Aeromicrobium piscarium]|uniref:Sodium:proton antiporter n=1 Tax=Aeromicrobium piscarium TaxID=2590901 RepID=A0A554RKA0_9ACTN|nr:proton-conducting transporter membrane subunit [Aeromicrobium piscarium]TSD54500.1 sodium:proton antiporter [Aeromicrobium piscarium]